MKKAVDPVGVYHFEQQADDYVFTWNDGAIEIRLSRIGESRGETSAEIKISTTLPPNQGCLEWGKVNLSAMNTRASLARSLTERLAFDWQGALLQVAHRAVEMRRLGEPSVDLTEVQQRETRWLLYPYVEYGGPTVLFADGGTGKSVLALMMAYSVATGKSLLGKPQGPPQNVLYLDWETDAETHAERLQAIHDAYAFGEDCPRIRHKRMIGGLADSSSQIRAEIHGRKIGMVVIDSLSLASGGPLEESATATAFFDVARSLKCCILAITHISKGLQQSGNQRANPFGSIFWSNNARVGWFVESVREEGDDTVVLRFEHAKSNNGRYHRQHGYRLVFHNVGKPGNERLAGITIQPVNLAEVPEFAEKLSWNQRIAAVLAHGKLTTAEIAEELGIDDTVRVSNELSKAKMKGRVIRFPDSTWGLTAQ